MEYRLDLICSEVHRDSIKDATQKYLLSCDKKKITKAKD
jgi:hypothetical protein